MNEVSEILRSSNSDFSGEFSLDNDHQQPSVVYELGTEKENGEVIFSFNFFV